MITKQFLTAGKAIFTLEVPETFQKEKDSKPHYTFKISKKKDVDIWFVNLLTGPDNMSDYTYIGKLNPDNGVVSLTRASKLNDKSLCFRLLNRVTHCLWNGEEGKIKDAGFDLHHEGRCGRCGRRLTVPESVLTGLGPECAGKS
jgi:Family of unknown function (DUF6011)